MLSFGVGGEQSDGKQLIGGKEQDDAVIASGI